MQGPSEVLEVFPDLLRHFLGLVSYDRSRKLIKDVVWICS